MSGRLIEWHTVRAALKKATDGTAKPRRRVTSLKTDKQRQRSNQYNLTLDFSALRQQINAVTQHRSLLYTRALYTKFDADGSLLQSSRVFHEHTVTRDGFHAPRTRSLLVQVVDEVITVGVFTGRDQFIVNHDAFTTMFTATSATLVSMRVASVDARDDSCMVRIESITDGTLTMDAIQAVFPAVLNDPPLAQGHPWTFPILTYKTFDTNGRITRIDVEIDWFGLLARAMADVVRVAQLVDEAMRAKQGLPYLNIAFAASERTVAPPRVETLWGMGATDAGENGGRAHVEVLTDTEETELEVRPSVDSRHTVAFLLS